MAENKIYVFCELNGANFPVGIMWTHIKGKNQTASFKYADSWLSHPKAFTLDPELYLTSSTLYTNKQLFGVFTDCSPDRWGRILMQRFERQNAKNEQRTPRILNETDFLLMVNDTARQGALRFKTSLDGPFLMPSEIRPIPPLVKLPELLAASDRLLTNQETDNDLKLLLVPGSSLGGARPKASVINKKGELCIAKFPRKDDTTKVELWESVALILAEKAGLNVPSWQLVNITDKPVLIMKRFDRDEYNKRLPFMSAMTMLGATDGDKSFTYTDIADGIRQFSSNPRSDMEELWRRIVFSVSISNTDDHLRNHGFLKNQKGWTLSPVYDVNPSIDNTEYLSTMIQEGDDSATIENAMSAAYYFEVSDTKANQILNKVQNAVSEWRNVAKHVGLSSAECNQMEDCFKIENHKMSFMTMH